MVPMYFPCLNNTPPIFKQVCKLFEESAGRNISQYDKISLPNLVVCLHEAGPNYGSVENDPTGVDLDARRIAIDVELTSMSRST